MVTVAVKEKESVAVLKQQIMEKAWTDEAFKAKLLLDPKAAIKEAFDISIPDSFKLNVVEETSSEFYLVIPASPAKVTADISPNSMWA